MGLVKVNVNKGSDSMELEIHQASSAQKLTLIDRLFKLFGVKDDIQTVHVQSPTISTEQRVEALKKKQIREVAQAKGEIEAAKERPRQVELINSERALRTSIGEQLKNVFVEKQDWWESGIKMKDDIPHYKCRYYCKNRECKKKSNHYILADEKEITCHGCGTRLKVRQASEEYMERDEWGNFFIADELVEVREGIEK